MRDTIDPFVGHRYQVDQSIGVGGMGQVFRATDRLTGQVVALKQIHIASTDLQCTSRFPNADPAALLLALAHEFRILASLRHPHIISVLDYGFDRERQPFFTMELLHVPQTLIHAGHAAPRATQLALLGQLLEALIYLHRRGVLHHDLKPDNVLVSAGQVRVLDFGLAVLPNQTHASDSFGSILYLAPEVLNGQPYTVAADLYAVGVLAYELFVGVHPFAAPTQGAFLDRVALADLDLTPFAEQPALQAIMVQLLVADPRVRFASASAALHALRTASGAPPAPEDHTIRDSFLQAATFVGRAAELAQLRAALHAALAGRSGTWLVGGESGVGKSRLVEELRAEALVAGALVLRGQAVEDGGQPYQLWRELLRHVALYTPLNDREASVLLDLVPDLPRLLNRPLVPAPVLDGTGMRQRLAATVGALLRRTAQSLVLLFEDLQWASESIDLLGDVLHQLIDHPVLVIGTYRADERPDLPQCLPSAQVLRLPRLSVEEQVALSVAMLGPAGERPEVIAMLAYETEGNAFFTVEVVRALAEEAGSLDQVGHTTLPTSVVAGGVQRLIQRRLARMPDQAHDLLALAAVAGRQLDLTVLRALITNDPTRWPSGDLAAWVQVGAEAAVLELADERWRFAHDKLRQGVLSQLDPATLSKLHRAVANALEAVYPNNDARMVYAEQLMVHWRHANDKARELIYLVPVARRLVDVLGAYAAAQNLVERGLQLLDTVSLSAPDSTKLHLFDLYGAALLFLGDLPQAAAQFHIGLTLADAHGDVVGRLRLQLHQAELHYQQGAFHAMQAVATESLALATQLHDQRSVAAACGTLGFHAWLMGDYVAAASYQHAALAGYQTVEDLAGQARCTQELGFSAHQQGQLHEANDYLMRSLQLGQDVLPPDATSMTLMLVGMLNLDLGAWEAARIVSTRSLRLAEQSNVPRQIALALSNLGTLYRAAGDYAVGAEHLRRAVMLHETHGITFGYGISLLSLGLIWSDQGDHAAAQQAGRAGLAQVQAAGHIWEEGYVLQGLGQIALNAGDLEHAQDYLDACVATTRGFPLLANVGLQTRGELYLSVGDLRAAMNDLVASRAIAHRLQHHVGLVATLATLARVQVQGGDAVAAQASVRAAATIARDLAELAPLKLAVLFAAAKVALYTGRQRDAARLAQVIIAHPRSTAPMQALARAFAGDRLPPRNVPDLDSLLAQLARA